MLTFGRSRVLSRCRLGLVASACLGWAALPIAAQEADRFYVGAGLGAADYESVYEGVAYADTPLGAHLYGGVQIRDRVAVELALTNLADIESGDILGSGIERLRISADYRAIAFKGMFSVALADVAPRWRKWTVFGTAGGYASEESRHVVELVSAQTSDDVTDDSGLVFGAGAIYRFSRLSVRAALESFDGRHADHTAIEVAVEFRF